MNSITTSYYSVQSNKTQSASQNTTVPPQKKEDQASFMKNLCNWLKQTWYWAMYKDSDLISYDSFSKILPILRDIELHLGPYDNTILSNQLIINPEAIQNTPQFSEKCNALRSQPGLFLYENLGPGTYKFSKVDTGLSHSFLTTVHSVDAQLKSIDIGILPSKKTILASGGFGSVREGGIRFPDTDKKTVVKTLYVEKTKCI